MREKRAAESELEKVSKYLPDETERLHLAIEEFSNKLLISERDRSALAEKLTRFLSD